MAKHIGAPHTLLVFGMLVLAGGLIFIAGEMCTVAVPQIGKRDIN